MVVAAQLEHIYTYTDLAALPDDGQRYEIIGGELIASPALILAHQDIVGYFFHLLLGFVLERKPGKVYVAPTDVRFSPHNVVEPDVIFVRRDRQDILHRAYVNGALDLVAEVLSDSSRRRDQVQRHALYAMAGGPEYWLLDPAARTIAVLSLVDEQYVPLPAAETGQVASCVVPEFQIDAAAFFSAPGP